MGIGSETYDEIMGANDPNELQRIKYFTLTGGQDQSNQTAREMIEHRLRQLSAKDAMNRAMGTSVDLARNFNPESQVNLGRASNNEQVKAQLANAIAQNQAAQNKRGMMFGAGQNMGLINQYGSQGVSNVTDLRKQALENRLKLNANAYNAQKNRQDVLSQEELIKYKEEFKKKKDKEDRINKALSSLAGGGGQMMGMGGGGASAAGGGGSSGGGGLGGLGGSTGMESMGGGFA